MGVFASSCTLPNTYSGDSKEEHEKADFESDSISTGLLTSSSGFEPSKEISMGGINFSIVLNESGDTTHWSTSDSKFKTPEGYKVGTNWEELPKVLKDQLDSIQGWGYYIKLNSGWQLGFCESESCTDKKPMKGSFVKWIFRRK